MDSGLDNLRVEYLEDEDLKLSIKNYLSKNRTRGNSESYH